jgi:hypothetical protein
MKRNILTLLLTLVVACAQGMPPIRNDGDAAVRAATITRQYHLTTLKTACLYFDTDDEGTYYLVRVREKHSRACGGDPDTSPTVFFMKLRKRDGHVTTTAYNVDGNFQRLKPPDQRPAKMP